MRRQRKVVLVLLGASVAAAALGSFLYVALGRIRVMDEQVALLRQQYLALPADAPTERTDLEARIESLEREQAEELSRYYMEGEMDLYRFGSLVSSRLGQRGITVERLRTVSGSSTPLVELSARGTSLALVAFLSDVSAQRKHWTMPYLHVQSPSGDGNVTCQMQIGYLVHEAAK